MTKRCAWARTPLSIDYHDNEWGVPLHDDTRLFEFLVLEGAQAGLSWETILNKRDNYRAAFDGFNPTKIAKYNDRKIEALMNNAGIIRNRLKINAAIVNAQKILQLQKECGSFGNWLDANHPLTKEEWTKLFKKTFVFTGGEIVNEFLMSTGYLPGAHEESCHVYKKVASLRPAWMRRG